MPRFFFDVDADQPDSHGVDLPDRQAARSEAIKAAGEMLKDIDGAFQGPEWTMQVKDDGGACVYELRFSVREVRSP